MDVAIRCTSANCSCECFSPCKSRIRICDGCGHGWVSHALDKLGYRHIYNCHQVEAVQPSIAFDIASLLLYGTQAIPVRLKILLDRLFSVLQRDEVLQVLHGFGWTYEDYARGYIIQDPSGSILDRWLLASKEEEPLIFQQFLRFGETKSIAQQLLLQESSERIDCVITPPSTESDIKKFIERTNNKSSVGSSLFKQHGNSLYSSMIYPMPTVSFSPGKSLYRHTSSVSSTQSNISSTVSSPIDCTSPIALSPLNKLQNMQPYDYRRDSPELVKESLDKQVTLAASTYTTINSPTTSVPSMCFTSSSLTSISSTNTSSLYTTANSEHSFNEEDICISEDEEGDGTNSAINLTRHPLTSSYLDSIYAAKKVRHLRKSAYPKRKYNPNILATLTLNPATGKKRVQCSVCCKTFCDKGALKIHFSAVHLREMHKCTVEGCNMMFSSRRSRNRHSANPNPKLHTPNCRRKINPHDGRAANPYPIPASSLVEYTNGFVPYPDQNECESNSLSGDEQRTMVPRTNQFLKHKIPLSPKYKVKSEDRLSESDDAPLSLTTKYRQRDNVGNLCRNTNEGMDLSVKDVSVQRMADLKDVSTDEKEIPIQNSIDEIKSKQHELKNESNDNDKTETEQSNKNITKISNLVEQNIYLQQAFLNNQETPLSVTPSDTNEKIKLEDKVKDYEYSHTPKKLKCSEPSQSNDQERFPNVSPKGVRKRKSLNPIRCPAASDDDLPFVSSDDSSSDTYIDQDNDENGLLDSKSDYLTSDGSDSLNDLDEFEENNTDFEKEIKNNCIDSNKSNINSNLPVSTAQTRNPGHTVEKKLRDHEQYNGFSATDLSKSKTTDQVKDEDISLNPLRHLESLSLGAFTNTMNVNSRTNYNHRSTSVSSGVSYHAPGLGLGSITTTTASNRAESPTSDMMPTLISNAVSHLPPPPLTSNCNYNNSDTDNSMSENQLSLVPVYRDASMMSSLEIPVDKENPRRCTACGKIFQNHFGVKTHYQNVHLKVMHKCTVDGCNAAFPSKRSRDRHSSNMNLHRKLLSTSSDRTGSVYFDKANTIYPFHADGYSRDLFSRFHEQNPHPLAAMEYYSRIPHDGTSTSFLPFAHLPGSMPGFHPAFFPSSMYTSLKNDNTTRYSHRHDENSGRNSSLSSISNPSSPAPSTKGSPKENSYSVSVKLDEELLPDHDGRFVCTICAKKFHECVVLREHYEKSHADELHLCFTNGCNKAFLSKQSKSTHTDNLHKERNADATS